MRDLLLHAGDPGNLAPLLTRAYNSVPTPPAAGAAATDGRSSTSARSSTSSRRNSIVSAADLSSSGMLFTVRAFMSRLVELLSLEPIDSSATSRVVASALALLGSFSSGSTECLACVGSWPVLGELGYELSGLVQKTAHPGILLQATSLLKVLLAPALTAMMNNYGVADSSSSAPSPAAAANAKTGVVALTTTDDVEDVLKPSTKASPPPSSTSAGGGPDVVNLASDRNPLWAVLVKLSASPVEPARLSSLQLLADLATVPAVAVALCRHHERPLPTDRKSAAVPPLPYAPPGSAHADEKARRAQVIKGRAHSAGSPLSRMVEGNEDDDDEGGGDSELSDVFGQDGGAAGFTNPFFRASVANSGDGGLRSSSSSGSSMPPSRSRSSSAPVKPGMNLRSSASFAERVSIAEGGSDPFGEDDAPNLPSGKRVNGSGARGRSVSEAVAGAGGAAGGVSKRPASSPVVSQVLSLLTHSGADTLDSATRRAALSFLSHLLTHAQLHDASVGPLLRAVCTPDLMATATEDFVALHAKARRRSDEMVAEAKAADVAHRMKPLLAAAAVSKPMLPMGGGGGSVMSRLMMTMPAEVTEEVLPPPPPSSSAPTRSRSMSAASHLFGDGPPLKALGRQQSAPLSPAYEDEPLRTSAEEAAAAAASNMVGRVSLGVSVSAAEESAVADLAALCLWHIGCLLAKQSTHVLARTRGVKPTDRFEEFAAKLLQQA